MFALPLLPTCRACVPGRWIGVLVLAVALAVALAATAGRATAGFTLGPEVNLSNSPEPSGVAEVSPQGLAVDGEGRVIVVWNEFKSADSTPEVAMRVSGPDGRFSPPVRLTKDDGKYSGEAALAVLPDGKVMVAWTQQNEQFAIWVARIDLAVGQLVEPKAIPGSASQLVMEPTIAAGPKGELAVAWTTMASMAFEVKLCRFQPGGGPGPIESLGVLGPSEQPCLTYGSDGRLHAVWVGHAAGVRQIFYSVHDGKQWQTPRAVEATDEPVKEVRPEVVIGPKEEVVVAWHDARQGGVDNVIVARAEPGKPFGKATAATRGSGTARSPALAAGPGGVYLAWEDGRVLSMAEPPSVQIYLGGLAAAAGPVTEEKPITTDRPVTCDHPAMVIDRTGTLHLMWRNAEIGQGDVFYRKATPGS
ncbi:MAG TPA: hypothetical protein VNM87_01620 [Candidatus Udaeobacter sp.]|nr:hypothetical protein [Candidatus Udaeobacter sp.]